MSDTQFDARMDWDIHPIWRLSPLLPKDHAFFRDVTHKRRQPNSQTVSTKDNSLSNMTQLGPKLQQSSTQYQQYFYHSDHLGSSSFISEASGEACQFLAYLPFGEQWVDQHAPDSYNTPYKFSGKELDAETGYNYFGARYYDSGLSVWLSVDPMADKYSNFSPYAYCYNNPLNFIDVYGLEGVEDGYKSRRDRFIKSGKARHGRQLTRYINNHSGELNRENASFNKDYNSVSYDIPNANYTDEQGSVTVVAGYHQGFASSNGIDGMDVVSYIVSNSGTLAGGAQYGLNSMSNKLLWKYSYMASKYLKGKGLNVQTQAIKHGANGVLKNASRKITYVGGVLAVADVAVDGELRASHILNAGMVGVSAIPIAGWIIGGGYFVADMITLGASGQSIGQHLDNVVGTPIVNDIYNW